MGWAIIGHFVLVEMSSCSSDLTGTIRAKTGHNKHHKICQNFCRRADEHACSFPCVNIKSRQILLCPVFARIVPVKSLEMSMLVRLPIVGQGQPAERRGMHAIFYVQTQNFKIFKDGSSSK